MFSVRLHNKYFPIGQFFADSHAFLHEFQLISGLVPFINGKVEVFASFSSLVNVDLSGTSPAAEKKGPKSDEKLEKEKSYIVSYLVNSVGLSPEKAVYACTRVHLRDSQIEIANSIVALLENRGFSKAQIAKTVSKSPGILGIRRKESLLLKLEFFKSVGMTKADLAMIVSAYPSFLLSSLEKKLIPNYNFLKSVLATDERVAAAIRRSSWILRANIDNSLAPNVKILRDLNMPELRIRLVLTQFPVIFVQNAVKFKETVSKVSSMGFDTSKSTFALALHVFSKKCYRRAWPKCYNAYISWGWSKDDIYMAFRKHPHCMVLSEKKISAVMNFLVDKMGWNTRLVARNPTILLLSLENRIIPRCSVIQLLKSRALVTEEVKMTTLLVPQEKYFLEKFVFKYEKELPGLYSFYKGKLGIEEFLRGETPH